MKIIITILAAGGLLALSGCALEQRYPGRFDTVTEVYPAALSDAQFRQAPATSRTGAEFNVPYADVFAVARRSVTQNQWNLHSSDEAGGVILATRAVKDQFRTGNGYIPVDRHYHYYIDIDEIAGNRSRVRAAAKTQGACLQANRGAYGALSMGISEAYINKEMKECRDVGSKTMWAEGAKSVKSELDNFVIVMRNNLLALGYE